ncbi:hypothetical protein FB451DRAFT_1206715 [Mycena latifolia]|nr:hypothetical protein FB451DRAFT_1206715 [Mycena latifolia]
MVMALDFDLFKPFFLLCLLAVDYSGAGIPDRLSAAVWTLPGFFFGLTSHTILIQKPGEGNTAVQHFKLKNTTQFKVNAVSLSLTSGLFFSLNTNRSREQGILPARSCNSGSPE